MVVKLRHVDDKSADEFIREMADKPYGEVNERIERITISLEGRLFDKVDDIVRKRKRTKKDNRTISAFIREAIEEYIINNQL
jgi:hypothetical protein